MPTIVQPARSTFNVWQETVPVSVPNAASETLVTTDVWIEELVLTGTAASVVTVTITDGSDVPLIKDISLAKGDMYQKILGARYCPGGIKWQASAAGIVGFIRWKY